MGRKATDIRRSKRSSAPNSSGAATTSRAATAATVAWMRPPYNTTVANAGEDRPCAVGVDAGSGVLCFINLERRGVLDK